MWAVRCNHVTAFSSSSRSAIAIVASASARPIASTRSSPPIPRVIGRSFRGVSFLLPRGLNYSSTTVSFEPLQQQKYLDFYESDAETATTTTTTTTTAKIAAAMSRTTNDVEDLVASLHKKAVLQGSVTYTDPKTGFTVFTELAHLERGVCCGNKCRHCPYGWDNVSTGERRPGAVARSGNPDTVEARLQQIAEERAKQPAVVAAKSESDDDDVTINNKVGGTTGTTSTTKKKTGGRHGGRLTDKNVPYTRGGDKGSTSLLTGERRSKADQAFEAMGTVDELTSVLGVVHAELERELEDFSCQATPEFNRRKELKVWLLDIMSRLFDIGSHVAKPRRLKKEDDSDASSEEDFVADGVGGGVDQSYIDELEDWIDQLTNDLPEIRFFILPTGTITASQLHVARCVCRRAERNVVPLVQQGVCDPRALQYLNRLSDFCFTAARWVNLYPGDPNRNREEILYRRPTKLSKQRERVSLVLEKDDETK